MNAQRGLDTRLPPSGMYRTSRVRRRCTSGNMAPSKQAQDVYAELSVQVDAEVAKFTNIKENDIPAFNELIRQKAVPVIRVK